MKSGKIYSFVTLSRSFDPPCRGGRYGVGPGYGVPYGPGKTVGVLDTDVTI